MTSSPKLVPDEVRKSIQTLILPPVSLGLSTQAHHSETGLGIRLGLVKERVLPRTHEILLARDVCFLVRYQVDLRQAG